MENISNVLFWISNGLLVPVIVGLLYFFIRALFLLGGVYGEYLERKKTERDFNEKLQKIPSGAVRRGRRIKISDKLQLRQKFFRNRESIV